MRLAITMATVLLASTLAPAAWDPATIPVRGESTVSMDEIDTAMKDHLANNEIIAGALAISHDGEVVYRKSFGWSDQDRTIPLEPNVMMRLASVTKPVTAAAIRLLVDEVSNLDPTISLESKVFTVGSSVGILNIPPYYPPLGGQPDPTQDQKLDQVTIRHLIEHRGGWSEGLDHVPQAPWWAVDGDLIFKEIQLSEWLEQNGPPDRDQVAQFILGQPLKFTPGAFQHYSNEGYFFLGLVIEESHRHLQSALRQWRDGRRAVPRFRTRSDHQRSLCPEQRVRPGAHLAGQSS